MKYIKTYENNDELNRINKILSRYYEKDDNGEDTGFSILMNYNEYEILRNEGLILILYNPILGKVYPESNVYKGNSYIRKKDRKIIQDKLELMRAAEKYNM